MALANENYLKTPEIYCFDEIEKRVNAYKVLHPGIKIIRLGVGDVTQQDLCADGDDLRGV
jgi:LL-diaminopimelate aminotransferase